MKKCLSIFIVVLLCVLLNSASADRYANASDYTNIEEFFEAIEMGTTVTVNGFVYLGPFAYEMEGVTGYSIGVFIDIPGCVRKNIFIMASKEQAEGLEEGDYLSISGQMFSRGNTGNNYFLNTQLENGFVIKLDTPDPRTLDLNDDITDMVSRVKEYRIGDIAKGESLKVVLTDEWTNTFSSKADTTYYYYYLSAGNLYIRFYTHTKDLFKGDIIDFQGIIYDYTEKNRILYCEDPVYNLHVF